MEKSGDPEASIRAGDLAAVLDRLRAGAAVNLRDVEGLTPLMVAAAQGQPQMADLLLTAGADVHAIDPRMGSTTLHKAAQSGNGDVVTLLLDAGAFIDQQSPILGNTPLMDAVLHKQDRAVATLLLRGARTTIRNHWQQTALDIAQADDLDAIARRIATRIEADTLRVATSTLLAASKAGDIDAVQRLIAEGTPVEQRAPVAGSFDDNYTPLGIAVREGHADIVRILLEAGADPRRTIGLMRGTPLHEAAYFGNAAIVRLLTSPQRPDSLATVELDAQGPYNGFTALHDAVWHGYLEPARALVEAGARLNIRTQTGLTARALASLYEYHDLAGYLAQRERG